MKILRRIKGRINSVKSPKLAKISFNMYPIKGPWGGSSTFVSQLKAFLEYRGYEVCFNLDHSVDLIILIDPRKDLQGKSYELEEIKNLKLQKNDLKVLHRINECDQRKATQFMDKLLADANELVDFTVFISEWLQKYHAERWFDKNKPHGTIYNGADSRFFHPIGNAGYKGSEPFRLVTHHWSDNLMKGFPVYQEVDDLIHSGKLKDIELWVIGRWPKTIQWKSAITFPPTNGKDLADKLRKCHAYITASLWEPCGMHHVEGAQCGLPLLYHEDGGGIVEAGKKYGIGFRENVKEAILQMRDEYPLYRDRLFHEMPSGDRMCIDYINIIQRLLS